MNQSAKVYLSAILFIVGTILSWAIWWMRQMFVTRAALNEFKPPFLEGFEHSQHLPLVVSPEKHTGQFEEAKELFSN